MKTRVIRGCARALPLGSLLFVVTGCGGASSAEPGEATREEALTASAVTAESSPIEVTPSLTFSEPQYQSGVGCGDQAGSQDVVVSNSGSTAVNITKLTLGLGAGSAYKVSATLPIPIPPKGQVQIPVQPNAVPATSLAGATFNDVLVVQTNAAGDAPHAVQLRETAVGAVPWLSASKVNLGTVSGAGFNQEIVVGNSGNLNYEFEATTPPGNPIEGVGGGGIEGGQSRSVSVTVFGGSGDLSATLAVTPIGQPVPICAGASASLSVDITAKEVPPTPPLAFQASPASLNFGQVPCATSSGSHLPPTEENVTIQTLSQTPEPYTASISGHGASFFSVNRASGETQGAFTQLTVSAAPISSTSGLTIGDVEFGLDAELKIEIGSGASEQTIVVPITLQPVGGYPRWSQSKLAVLAGSSSSATLLSFSLSQFSLSSTNDLFSVSAGEAFPGIPFTVADNATGSSLTTIEVSIPESAPLCGPLPENLPVTGL